jgi:hypothetical protein
MSSDDRTFILSEIRKARAEVECQLALLQRRADAYRKMEEAAEELELADREMSPDREMEPALFSKPPTLEDPGSSGRRAKVILQSDKSRKWTPRDVWAQMVERGWAEDTKDARTAIRVALKRLHERERDHITRTEDGLTHAYQWVDAA